MSTPKSRRMIYMQARAECALTEIQWGRLYSLGEPGGHHEVRKKERDPKLKSSRKVSMSEALAANLLRYLHQTGKDINAIEFDELGNITEIPDR